MTLFNLTLDFGQWWERIAGKRPPVVLVVDDDALTVALIMQAAHVAGYSVEIAKTAEEAIGILHANGRRFVVALVDVRLPGMDGWTLRRELRAHWPHLPIVIMSGAPESFHEMPIGDRLSVMIKPSNYGQFFQTLPR